VSRRNLIEGPIVGSLLAFALPTLASNVLQSLNGSINAMWVGHLLGETGLAATSNANLILFTLFALSFGFGMATTIFVGQNMGRRDLPQVRRFVGAGVDLFILFGICAALGGWLEAPALLRLLDTPPDVYPTALEYVRVVFLGLPPGLLIVFLQLALRGTGDSVTPLLFIIPSALIDVGLNPVLILGLGPAPKMGIAGSATASVIANYISALLLISYVYARNLPIRLRGAELRYLLPSRDLILTIVRKGVPMGLQMIVVSGASLAMMGLVNRDGTRTTAAYGAISQLWTYIQMPSVATAAAVSTIAAHNIGAGRWDRIGRIASAGVVMNILLTGMLVLIVTVSDRYMLSLFLGDDGAAIAIARHINLLASWSFVLAGVMLVLSAIPRANGATVAPLVIMFLALVPGRLGVAYAMIPAIGVDALWWSFPVSYLIAVILAAGYYRYGGWRKLRLLTQPSREESDEFVETEAEPVGRVHPNG
jgi:putative MATE family efflux protein